MPCEITLLTSHGSLPCSLATLSQPRCFPSGSNLWKASKPSSHVGRGEDYSLSSSSILPSFTSRTLPTVTPSSRRNGFFKGWIPDNTPRFQEAAHRKRSGGVPIRHFGRCTARDGSHTDGAGTPERNDEYDSDSVFPRSHGPVRQSD